MSDSLPGSEPPPSERSLLREFADLLYGSKTCYAGVLSPDGSLEYANAAARSLVDASGADVEGALFWETPWFDHDPEVQAAVRQHVAAAVGGERRQFTTTHEASDGETVTVDLDLQPLPAPAVADAGTRKDVFAVAVTGHRETATDDGEAEATLDALAALYDSTTDDEDSFGERVQTVLELGSDHLGLDVGFYTKIDGGVQLVRASVGDHPLLQPGEQADLGDAYCKETIAESSPTVMEDVWQTPFADDPAYDVFGLECYIGAEIRLGDTTHGTLCFADREPRAAPITESDEAFVSALAGWLEHELEHEREREQLARQADRLEEFAGVVAHDLRNPLNVASGHLDLAATQIAAGDSGAEAVADAQSAVDRMAELVEDVRSLASEGAVVGNPETVSLREVAEEAASTALPETATLTVETDAGEYLSADPERLRTVFENFFRNSREHGGDDIAVTVTSVDPQAGGGDAGFSVVDDGPGFGDIETAQVFEQGYTTRPEGTGYGLSIVEAIVDAHGWTVSAADAEGGGARFDVRGVEFEPEL
ncbi:GAF domain-containing sensor histidine kinase [Halobacterium jilantaiense]|uniref:histidine kinase n=1 Tax=Halobacterium jilantaiense TaxID=355548 RepID=A0A1I0NAT3_9EURY|nr:ATP-binding protein [Halobacterium jilantaiense]SEV98100.1 PAS fold-containing protein [Halobacterium jilantaiense]